MPVEIKEMIIRTVLKSGEKESQEEDDLSCENDPRDENLMREQFRTISRMIEDKNER